MAYNLQDNKGEIGDGYFRQVQPVVANLPYLAVCGNHETMSGQFSTSGGGPGVPAFAMESWVLPCRTEAGTTMPRPLLPTLPRHQPPPCAGAI